jgi:hypothetical protein
MSSSLNPQQFFHGTTHAIQGGVLRPSSAHGTTNYDYDDFADGEERKASVFVTSHEDAAWAWAQQGENNNGRPRVHSVKPEGPMKVDTAGSGYSDEAGYNDKAYMVPRAEVTDTHWIPKPTRHTGPIQGSLPPLNWAQHHDIHLDPMAYRSDAHSMAHSDRVEKDRTNRKTVADYHVEDDKKREYVNTKRNLATHPKLF